MILNKQLSNSGYSGGFNLQSATNYKNTYNSNLAFIRPVAFFVNKANETIDRENYLKKIDINPYSTYIDSQGVDFDVMEKIDYSKITFDEKSLNIIEEKSQGNYKFSLREIPFINNSVIKLTITSTNNAPITGKLVLYRNDNIVLEQEIKLEVISGENEKFIVLPENYGPTHVGITFNDPSPAYTILKANIYRLAKLPLQSNIRITRFDPNHIYVRVSNEKEGYLILQQTYYSGWKATVDGIQVPILMANGIFRAIKLEPGEHRIALRFEPFDFYLGVLITGLYVVTVILFCLKETGIIKSVNLYFRNRRNKI